MGEGASAGSLAGGSKEKGAGAMTADIRAAAQREAEQRWPDSFVGQIAAKHDFVHGAVWAAERVTPTREQIAEVIASSGAYGFKWEQVRPMTRDAYLAAADAILTLLAELVEQSD